MQSMEMLVKIKRQNPTFYMCYDDNSIKTCVYVQRLARTVENDTS